MVCSLGQDSSEYSQEWKWCHPNLHHQNTLSRVHSIHTVNKTLYWWQDCYFCEDKWCTRDINQWLQYQTHALFNKWIDCYVVFVELHEGVRIGLKQLVELNTAGNTRAKDCMVEGIHTNTPVTNICWCCTQRFLMWKNLWEVVRHYCTCSSPPYAIQRTVVTWWKFSTMLRWITLMMRDDGDGNWYHKGGVARTRL